MALSIIINSRLLACCAVCCRPHIIIIIVMTHCSRALCMACYVSVQAIDNSIIDNNNIIDKKDMSFDCINYIDIKTRNKLTRNTKGKENHGNDIIVLFFHNFSTEF